MRTESKKPAVPTKSKRKPGSGGARQGAGKKLKYGGETTTMTIRLPVSLKDDLQAKFPGTLNETIVKRLTQLNKNTPK